LIQGRADGHFPYACTFVPLKAGPGQPLETLVAEGSLGAGGITVGIQVNAQWVFQENIDEQGPFVVLWQPPDDREYQLVIAHYLPGRDRFTQATLTHFGWFRRDERVNARIKFAQSLSK
jgi:hypothetical protein